MSHNSWFHRNYITLILIHNCTILISFDDPVFDTARQLTQLYYQKYAGGFYLVHHFFTSYIIMSRFVVLTCKYSCYVFTVIRLYYCGKCWFLRPFSARANFGTYTKIHKDIFYSNISVHGGWNQMTSLICVKIVNELYVCFYGNWNGG